MKKINILKYLINFLKEKKNEGQNTISIPLQKKERNLIVFKFTQFIKTQNSLYKCENERVMPADTIFKWFNLVLNTIKNK